MIAHVGKFLHLCAGKYVQRESNCFNVNMSHNAELYIFIRQGYTASQNNKNCCEMHNNKCSINNKISSIGGVGNGFPQLYGVRATSHLYFT